MAKLLLWRVRCEPSPAFDGARDHELAPVKPGTEIDETTVYLDPGLRHTRCPVCAEKLDFR